MELCKGCLWASRIIIDLAMRYDRRRGFCFQKIFRLLCGSVEQSADGRTIQIFSSYLDHGRLHSCGTTVSILGDGDIVIA